MTNNIKFALGFSILALTFSSCKKDSEITKETEDYKGLIVVNEGGFNKSNGSLGVYKPGTKTYFDAFKKANDRPLGDVVQSIAEMNGKLYIVVNNSNKIEVINKSDFKSVTSISSTSPRFMVNIGNNKAVLSNLYDNSVKIVDLNTNAISAQVNINHWSDALSVLDSVTYIATLDNKVMLLNNKKQSLMDSVSTATGLSKVVNLGPDNLAFLCTGLIDWNSGNTLENGTIQIYNSDSGKITLSVPLSGAGYGGSMVYDASAAAVYFNLGNNVIQKMTLAGLISTYITLPSGVSVYGLSIDTIGNLYVTDAGNFNSAGKVYVYNSAGTKTNEFSAGIAPSAVWVND